MILYQRLFGGVARSSQPSIASREPGNHNKALELKVVTMEKSSKRGKIPQQDWPSIIERYESGETLASIARTYDCSPPAISYIVSRSRARSGQSEPAPSITTPAPETHLVKSRLAETAPPEPAQSETGLGFIAADSAAAPPNPAESRDSGAAVPANAHTAPIADLPVFRQPAPQLPAFLRDPPRSAGNGMAERQSQVRRDPPIQPTPGNGSAARPAGPPPANAGEPRGRLHLSLPHGTEGAHEPDPPPRQPQNPGFSQGEERFDRRLGGAPMPPRSQQGYPAAPPPPAPVPYARPASPSMETERSGEAGGFIGQALRERVDGDIAAFLAAFDAALDHDTLESRAGLREATDRLLRAGARTRIELERLEARIPLSSRDRGGQPPIMRQR
jgi:transposase-like protein